MKEEANFVKMSNKFDKFTEKNYNKVKLYNIYILYSLEYILHGQVF